MAVSTLSSSICIRCATAPLLCHLSCAGWTAQRCTHACAQAPIVAPIHDSVASRACAFAADLTRWNQLVGHLAALYRHATGGPEPAPSERLQPDDRTLMSSEHLATMLLG